MALQHLVVEKATRMCISFPRNATLYLKISPRSHQENCFLTMESVIYANPKAKNPIKRRKILSLGGPCEQKNENH